MHTPLIHRYTSRPEAALVNAYIVETTEGAIIVDATLTVSSARGLRDHVEALAKPLLGIVVTHGHPDHYGGLGELVAGREVPIFATEGVRDVIVRDDPVKETILRPMFGTEWPRSRTYPNCIVTDGETVNLGGVELTVRDLGPGESPHDSIWLLDNGRHVFLGDQIYNHVHCYLADGYHQQWLANIARLERDLDVAATLHVGHGEATDVRMFAWQRGYIEAFLEAVSTAAWDGDRADAQASVVAAVGGYLPSADDRFLMELSIEPVARQLGLLSEASRSLAEADEAGKIESSPGSCSGESDVPGELIESSPRERPG